MCAAATHFLYAGWELSKLWGEGGRTEEVKREREEERGGEKGGSDQTEATQMYINGAEIPHEWVYIHTHKQNTASSGSTTQTTVSPEKVYTTETLSSCISQPHSATWQNLRLQYGPLRATVQTQNKVDSTNGIGALHSSL